MKVKRILSSIMAAVMVATSLVAVNVSSVWAATATTDSQQLVDATATLDFGVEIEGGSIKTVGSNVSENLHFINGISVYNSSGRQGKYESKTITLEGKEYKGCYTTGGSSYSSGRQIGFKLNRAATVDIVYAASGTGSRNIGVYKGLIKGSKFDTTGLVGDVNTTTSTAEGKKTVNISSSDITDKTNGDLFVIATSDGYRIYAVTVTPEAKTATADKYTWAVSVPDSLKGIDPSEISFGSAKTEGTATNTIKYTGTKYDITDKFPTEIKTTDTFVETKQGDKIGETSFYNYTATVTLDTDWFKAKPKYDISGTVYNSATLEPLAGVAVKSSASTATATTDPEGKFTIADNIGNADLTYTIDGYKGKTVTYTGATTDAVVDLVPKNINNGTSTLRGETFYKRAPYVFVGSKDNIEPLDEYTVNGFTFKGVSLQIADSGGTHVKTGEYEVGRINVKTGTGYYINYTPEADGTLKIVAATGKNGDYTHKVSIDQGSTNVGTIEFENDKLTTKEINVEKGKEYKISAVTGTINIYEATFTPAPVEEPAFVIDTISPTANDKEFIIIGKFVGENIEDYELVGIKVGKTKECNNDLKTSDTLYNGVKVTEGNTFTGQSIFAVLVSGVESTAECDTIYAMGYSKKNNGAGVYSGYQSRLIDQPVTNPTDPTTTTTE